MKIRSITIVVGLLIALAMAVPACAATWDIHDAHNGNNPNGPWYFGFWVNTAFDGPAYGFGNYGYMSTWGGWNDPGEPRYYVYHRFDNSWDGFAKWYIPYGFMPNLAVGDVTLSGANSTGPEGNTVSYIKFTAPSAGDYKVDMNFDVADNRYDSGPSQTISVVINDSVVGTSPITAWGQSYSFAGTYSLNANDTVYFITDKYMPLELNGGISQVPEPSSILALLGGLTSIGGLAIRRRR